MSMTLKVYMEQTGKKLSQIQAYLEEHLSEAPDLSTISRHANRQRQPDWNQMNAYRLATGGLVDFPDWGPPEEVAA